MSKKEFVKAAAIVQAAAARDAKTGGAVMAAFVLLFQDVPRFDLPRFVKACATPTAEMVCGRHMVCGLSCKGRKAA